MQKYIKSVIEDVEWKIDVLQGVDGEGISDIYELLDYLKVNYRADSPEWAYEKMVSVVYEHFKGRFKEQI
tara:strand:+ start:15394 stop:15603 length:210 start_codon:yes stop_codon:yes gene_type:complete